MWCGPSHWPGLQCQVQKCYVAVVHGHPPEKGHITEALRLVQLGGGTKYRAFVDDTGKVRRCWMWAEFWEQQGCGRIFTSYRHL